MTTEELNEIRNRLACPNPMALDCHRLLVEVERLQKAVAEARSIIEHVGYSSANDFNVIAKANTWMQENK